MLLLSILPCGKPTRGRSVMTSVKVIHGANDDVFEGIAGMTVEEVQRNLVDAFNIPVDAISIVNGVCVGRIGLNPATHWNSARSPVAKVSIACSHWNRLKWSTG